MMTRRSHVRRKFNSVTSCVCNGRT